MRHRARWIALGAGAVVLLLAALFAFSLDEDPGFRGGRLVGRSAPALDLTALDGAALTSDDLAGKTVVVNFWNDWCIPCRQEQPALAAFYESHRDDPGFEMIGIVRDQDDTDAIRDYAQSEGVDWVVALDPGGKAALDFGTFGQPETYVIAADGMVTDAFFGPATLGDLESMLAAATGAATAATGDAP